MFSFAHLLCCATHLRFLLNLQLPNNYSYCNRLSTLLCIAECEFEHFKHFAKRLGVIVRAPLQATSLHVSCHGPVVLWQKQFLPRLSAGLFFLIITVHDVTVPTSTDCSEIVRCFNFSFNDEIPIDFRLRDGKLLLDHFRKSRKVFCCFSIQQLCANEDNEKSRP